jgi:GMP synthase-like glutamine amidotransferase
MMKILLVENSPNVARSFSYLSGQTDIAVVKPYRYEKYPAPKEFDAIIVTGGRDSIGDAKYFPYLKIESQFLLRAMNLRVPILGICLGCQIIADALGGIVSVSSFELGWIKITLTTEGLGNPLFRNVPMSFYAFERHRDEISCLPPGAIRLAKSDSCKIQAFQYQDKPIWGVQFHPENKRGKNKAMDAINETNNTILRNFLEYARR